MFVSTEKITELAADDGDALPVEWLEKAEKRRYIMRMIDALPEGQRMAIFLHYVEGLPITEIADIMGVAKGTVKNSLYRGRQAIKAFVLEEEKKGNKLYGLVPMPMLAKVFEMEAESAVMPEALSKAVWERTLARLIENGVIKSASVTSDAGTRAVGAEAANKGGLIKMFLGLSTGKKIGVIAASLVVLICLSLLASALAAPTPTPTLGGVIAETTPTPTPGIGAPPPPGRDGPDGPGGGGAKPGDSDGPSGTGKPEATAPPKKETPPDEDNIPTEVDPDDVPEKPFKPKKSKIKKMVGTYTITAKGTRPRVEDQYTKYDYTLDFQATKVGGPYIEGDYSGKWTLQTVLDTAHYLAGMAGDAVHGELDTASPLTDIQFTLVDPDEGKLAPLVRDEDTLAPLVPPTMAEGAGTMFWNPIKVKDRFVLKNGRIADPVPDTPPESLKCKITVYKGGSAVVTIWFRNFSLSYPGRLVKSVKLLDEK